VKAGIAGYILKNVDLEESSGSSRRVHRGDRSSLRSWDQRLHGAKELERYGSP